MNTKDKVALYALSGSHSKDEWISFSKTVKSLKVKTIDREGKVVLINFSEKDTWHKPDEWAEAHVTELVRRAAYEVQRLLVIIPPDEVRQRLSTYDLQENVPLLMRKLFSVNELKKLCFLCGQGFDKDAMSEEFVRLFVSKGFELNKESEEIIMSWFKM